MMNKEHIIVNQLGYRPQDFKLAVIEGEADQYHVINTANKQIVWAGKSSSLMDDAMSGTNVSKLDFSSLRVEGQYIIQGSNGQSIPFQISNECYHDVHRAVFKAFYFLRCGVKLDSKYAGPWEHEACHCSPAIVYTDRTKQFEANGGWHDAGDYGKYIVAAGKAVADLLLAYELYPHAFTKKIPLPESDQHMDDILHEVKVELDWMLKMQDKLSGGVYHKLTTLQFPPLDTMPEDDNAPLYAMPISSTATASFAATLSMAARVYAPYLPEYSEQCLKAATYAWKWLEEHQEQQLFKNPVDVGTGEYGDVSDADERYWAAAELYRTTGDPIYHQAFKHYAAQSDIDKTALGWANMGGYGTFSYLLCERDKDTALVQSLKRILSDQANNIIARCKEDGFHISLEEQHYHWGSNMDLLNHAVLLLVTQHIEKHEHYSSEIASHLHYLLGLNINRISYISGFGHRAMQNPHYRPSVADQVDETVPGLVSGGPNRNLQDECAAQHLQNKAPAACYIDHIDSYSTNEITIYWNSPALFVLSSFV